LQLAPTPPPKSTDTNVGETKVRKADVIGGYSQLRNSEFSKNEAKDNNSEGNNVITTLPPFTRYSSRKCAAVTDEKNFNKCSSTSPRGKSYEGTHQVRNIHDIFSPLSVFSVHRQTFQVSSKVFLTSRRWKS
jgi:hypothetical protein